MVTKRLAIAFAVVGLVAGVPVAQAQVNRPHGPKGPSTPHGPQGPRPYVPQKGTVPEQMLPNNPGGYQAQDNGTARSLSKRLDESGGVLKPPTTITPKMTVVPPAPHTDSGAVIAPSELPQSPERGQSPTPHAD